jgi:type II secretory pathway component PulF
VRWRYHAADATGADVAGEIEAASEREAVDALRRRALWVTTLEPIERSRRVVATTHPESGTGPPAQRIGSGGASRLRTALASLGGASSSGELAVTIRAMSTLLGAGVPLDRALAYAAGPSARPELQRAFGAVRERVRGGESLSSAAAREPLFPAVLAPTVAAGEASGTLDRSLASLADHLDRVEALRGRLRAALVYPAVLGVASLVGIVVILLVVVPRFATLVADSGGALPVSTRLLVAASALVSRWWWLLLAGAALGVTLARRWLQESANRLWWHAARLRWPVVGHIERTRAAAAYAGVLSVALGAGVSLLSAMRLARGVVANGAIASSLRSAEERVGAGGGVAESLEGVLPPLSVRLLDAGEAGGNLAAMAARASEAADGELQRAATGAVALVEPLLIIGFGGLVGFVALALLQAIYGLNARTL